MRLGAFSTRIGASLVAAGAMVFLTASAAHAQSTLQPFTCNSSTAQVVDNSTPFLSIGQLQKVVQLANVDGNTGVLLTGFPERSFLVNGTDGFAVNIRLVQNTTNARNLVNVRFFIKPEISQPNIVTVDLPLREFGDVRFDNFHQYWEARARRTQIWPNSRPGSPNLVGMVVYVDEPGTSLALGNVAFVAEGLASPNTIVPTQIVLTNAPCGATAGPGGTGGGGSGGGGGNPSQSNTIRQRAQAKKEALKQKIESLRNRR